MSIFSRSFSSRIPASLRMRRSSVMSSLRSAMVPCETAAVRLKPAPRLSPSRGMVAARSSCAPNLRDLLPSGPSSLDGVVQRPSARAEDGVDDHEEEEYKGVDDPGPDVRGTRTIGTSEPLGHRPDNETEEDARRVRHLPHESEEEGETKGQLQRADRRDEKAGVRAHGLAPEAEPRLQPARLSLARVRDHLSQRVGEARLELERSIDEPDHAEDHSHRGL